jgi:hypothetical protein
MSFLTTAFHFPGWLMRRQKFHIFGYRYVCIEPTTKKAKIAQEKQRRRRSSNITIELCLRCNLLQYRIKTSRSTTIVYLEANMAF